MVIFLIRTYQLNLNDFFYVWQCRSAFTAMLKRVTSRSRIFSELQVRNRSVKCAKRTTRDEHARARARSVRAWRGGHKNVLPLTEAELDASPRPAPRSAPISIIRTLRHMVPEREMMRRGERLEGHRTPTD